MSSPAPCGIQAQQVFNERVTVGLFKFCARGERLISWDVLCSETAESAARTEVPRLSAQEEAAQKGRRGERGDGFSLWREALFTCSVKARTCLRDPEDILTAW